MKNLIHALLIESTVINIILQHYMIHITQEVTSCTMKEKTNAKVVEQQIAPSPLLKVEVCLPRDLILSFTPHLQQAAGFVGGSGVISLLSHTVFYS